MKTILILVLLAFSANAIGMSQCIFAGMGAASQFGPQLQGITSAQDLVPILKNNFDMINKTLATCGVHVPLVQVDNQKISLVVGKVFTLLDLAQEIFDEYLSLGASESLAQSVVQLVKVDLFEIFSQVSYVLNTVKLNSKQIFDLPTNFSSLTDLQYNVFDVQKCYSSVVSIKDQALPLVPQVLKFDFQSIYMEIGMIAMRLPYVKQECQIALESVELSNYLTKLSNWWAGQKLESHDSDRWGAEQAMRVMMERQMRKREEELREKKETHRKRRDIFVQ